MPHPTSPSSPGAVVGLSGLVLGLGALAVGVALVRRSDSAFGATGAALFVVVGVVALLSLVTFLPGSARTRADTRPDDGRRTYALLQLLLPEPAVERDE